MSEITVARVEARERASRHFSPFGYGVSLSRFRAQFLAPTWNGVLRDGCVDLAAQMSFYFVLALFPFLLVLAALAGWLPSTTLWHKIVQWAADYLPIDSRKLVFETIVGLTTDYPRFLSLGIIVTIWTASSGFVSLMESLSVTYGVPETRTYLWKRIVAICATAISAIFMIGSFGLMALSHWLSDLLYFYLRVPLSLRFSWEIARWMLNLSLILIALDLVRYFLPNGARRWRWCTPGTMLASISFVLCSAGFNLYLRHSHRYPQVYGALAAFIILLTWIYVSSVILLVGAELDRVVDHLKVARTAS